MDDPRTNRTVAEAAAAIVSGEDLTAFAERLEANGGPAVHDTRRWVHDALVRELEQSTVPVADLQMAGETPLESLVRKAGRLLYGHIRGDEPTGALGELWSSQEAEQYRGRVLNVLLR